ncbi:MAG: hypothetical protein Q9160_000203 [Pyrenula sp. 1 TL-2023]
MSERKVISKYIPPDFDPAKITRTSKSRSLKVTQMSSFKMKCERCGEYIPKGRKFNATKEIPTGEEYLEIQIVNFWIRCTRCTSEIMFQTDPKNADYKCKVGAKRIIEPWRATGSEAEEQRLRRLGLEEQEESHTAMQDLEERARDTQREMAEADALDNIRMVNAAREQKAADSRTDIRTVSSDQKQQEEQDKSDADEARRAFRSSIVKNQAKVRGP